MTKPINGANITESSTGVAVGEVQLAKKNIALLSPLTRQSGHGISFMLLNQYQTEIDETVLKNIRFLKDNKLNNKQKQIKIKKYKDIIWFSRVGTFANDIDGESSNFNDRIYKSSIEFKNSVFGDCYENVYPIKLDNSGSISLKGLSSQSFFTGSIKAQNAVKSIGITSNSYFSPLTRVTSSGYLEQDKSNTINLNYIYGEDIGGRNLVDLSNGRSFASAVAGGRKDGTFEFKGEVFDDYDVRDRISPYILDPKDKLVLLCANQNLPYEPQQHIEGITQSQIEQLENSPSTERNIATLFKTKILPGSARLTLYGSYLRHSKPIHEDSSQQVSNLEIKEATYGSILSDQFVVNNRLIGYKNYLSKIIFDKSNKDNLLDRGLKSYYHDYKGPNRLKVGLQNFIRCYADNETFYDSHVPIISDIIKLSGHKYFDIEDQEYSVSNLINVTKNALKNKNILVFPGINYKDVKYSPLNKDWLYSFPFEDFYKTAQRAKTINGSVLDPINSNNVIDSILFLNNNLKHVWKKISAGNEFTIAIKEDGTLWSWGDNSFGKTGLNVNFGVTKEPTQIGVDTDWKEVSAGYSHSLAIKEDGTLWSWGNNEYGATGLGTYSGNTLIPTQIGADDYWLSISAGFKHSLAINSANEQTGTVYSWGDNTNGQLGLGNSVSVNTPTEVENIYHDENTQLNETDDIFKISAGGSHSLILQFNGAKPYLYSCGLNSSGQLGRSINNNSNVFVRVDSEDDILESQPTADWLECSAGYNHTIALSNRGLYSWGNNEYGQLGLGDKFDRQTPTKTPALNNVQKDVYAISAGNNVSFVAGIVGGLIFAFGSNKNKQIWWSNKEEELSISPYFISSVGGLQLPAVLQMSVGQNHISFVLGSINHISNNPPPPIEFSQYGKLLSKGLNNKHQFGYNSEVDLECFVGRVTTSMPDKSIYKNINSLEEHDYRDMLRLFYCFGDFNKTAINISSKSSDIFPFYTQTSQDTAEGNNYISAHRGCKYGLLNPFPIERSVIFRSNSFGQFRDMLEPALDSKHYTKFEFNGKIIDKLVDSPVSVKFVNSDDLSQISPENTTSANLSFSSETTMPFFDGRTVDR